MTLKKTLLILSVTILTATIGSTAFYFLSESKKDQETVQTADMVQTMQVNPIIESIFYNLPLDKSRVDLREAMINDKRFMLTDTTFNNFEPSSFFKGITVDKGLIQSNPDSIQIMLVYGNAALVTEKGGQEDFNKHPMILDCKYFYSNKDSVEEEYERLLNLVHPIFSDTTSIKDDNWETQYSMGIRKGTQKCIGKIFDNFEPYYRVSISSVSLIPDDQSKPIFVLEMAFSKEDK